MDDCWELDKTKKVRLAYLLEESPETVISIFRLKNNLARVYAVGSIDAFSAVLIQGDIEREEPVVFGLDVQAIWKLLENVSGWSCVNVSLDCSEVLGEIMKERKGCKVKYYEDIYFTYSYNRLRYKYFDKLVRRLTVDDLELLRNSELEVQGKAFGCTEKLLTEGVVAGAIVDGRVVAIAHTSAISESYADIGVYTLEPWRKKGFAKVAAEIVRNELVRRGKIPVWSTGEDNKGSLRLAEKLGFIEFSRRVYLIPEK